ncbi:MAG: sugar nucleotide-binding protein, partial [Deltaproteobacteria bacterium]
MNILIIGASGFIGQCLYNRARQNGHIVLGTRFSRGDSELLSFDLTRQDIFDIVPADFWEADEMAAVICSAIPKIDLCYRDKAGSTFLNVTRTIDLIDKLQARNVKTVFLSTDAVFDGIQGYYDETNHPNPLNEYGRQKQEVENYLLATHAESLIVRMGMVVGDDPASSHLFAEWYQKICNKQAIACIKG